jgi:hypothetical protein
MFKSLTKNVITSIFKSLRRESITTLVIRDETDTFARSYFICDETAIHNQNESTAAYEATPSGPQKPGLKRLWPRIL